MFKIFTVLIFAAIACYASQQTSVFTILENNADELVIQLVAPQFHIKNYAQQQQLVQHIEVDGFSQSAVAGEPQLPVAATSIAIPSTLLPQLTIIEQHYTSHRVEQIVSTPFLQRDYAQFSGDVTQDMPTVPVFRPNEKIYRSAAAFPSQVVELGEPFVLRGQQMLSLIFHPVQYFPAQNEFRYFDSIRIRLKFTSSLAKPSQVVENVPVFQNLVQNLALNSAQAAPRQSAHLSKTAQDYFLDNGQEWLKILFDKKGMYKISATDLQDAGMDVANVDPRMLQMYWQGQQVAINVVGEQDGSFDADDYIEFYGFNFESRYTTRLVFWLTEGTIAGKRMLVKDAAPDDANASVHSDRQTFYYEASAYHNASYPGHTDQDNWFMGYTIAPNITNYTFSLDHINFSDTLVTLTMNGRGLTSLELNPDHHTIISFNGTELLNEFWDGFDQFIRPMSFHSSLLVDGQNTISINEPGDTGATVDWFFHDYYKVAYNRFFTAINDTLAMDVLQTGSHNIISTAFTASDIRVFNVSDSLNPQLLQNYTMHADTLTFADSAELMQRYELSSSAQLKTPVQISKDVSGNLRDAANQADYLIISHADFLQAIQPLADFHQANGLNVKIVDVADIYDEFNYGLYSDYPIRDFLQYAYHIWQQPPPAFVLLVGDGSYNPRLLAPGTYGAERSDYIPTRLFEASADFFEAVSDNWFVAVDGDDIVPDMLIGRINARKAEEVSDVVIKTIGYSTLALDGDWYNRVTFVCDNGEGGLFAFEDSTNAIIADVVPTSLDIEKIYIADLGKTQTHTNIYDAFNSGRLLINYLGHGSATTWMGEQVLKSTDVNELRGGINLPFLVTMSCSNGYFVYPLVNFYGLAEALLLGKQRGAIGVLSGGGKAYAAPLYVLGRSMYTEFFHNVDKYPSAFTMHGLIDMYQTHLSLPDHLMFHVFFGDPAMQLPYQPSWQYVAANFSGGLQVNQQPAPENSVVTVTVGDSLQFSTTVTTAGSYAIRIPTDNPDTLAKDGAVEGDTLYFRLTLPDSVYYLLEPSAVWHANSHQQLHFSVTGTRVADTVDFQFYMNDKKLGEDFVDGDYLPLSSQIIIQAFSPSRNQHYDLYLNQQKITTDAAASTKFTNQGYLTEFDFSTLNLPDGSHSLLIAQIDTSNNARLATAQVNFTIQSNLSVMDVVNWPNPMAEQTSFTFIMQNDQPASGNIQIYTVAGRKIQTLKLPMVDVGYNSFQWDGIDNAGDRIANGVYLYKLTLRDGSEKVDKFSKIIVIR